mmetsp:Transcript_119967/g.208875  ORF Transcript_119967/g.208875 Transcript_119967/m.208875 type:complete len:81 (-) Transcript_119967:465-707(-)
MPFDVVPGNEATYTLCHHNHQRTIQPLPQSSTPASHFALSRSACHEKAKNPMHEAYLRCDIANKKANSTIRKQTNFITEL